VVQTIRRILKRILFGESSLSDRRRGDPEQWQNPGFWKEAGVVLDTQPLEIGGTNVWDHQWRSKDVVVNLPHPAHRHQIHELNVYSIDVAGREILFSAGELSNCVWGFYVPAR
jgi:hypothetical protein